MRAPQRGLVLLHQVHPPLASFRNGTKACPAAYHFVPHRPALMKHTLLFPARLAGGAASGVLLLTVFVAHFSVALAAMATPEPAGVSVVPSSGTADEAVGAKPARRRGNGAEAYAVHCWAPNSSFTDPSCNCIGEGAHPKLGYRRTIRIIVGSWYGRPSPQLRSRSISSGMRLTRDERA